MYKKAYTYRISHFTQSLQISLEQCILRKNVSDKSFGTKLQEYVIQNGKFRLKNLK